MRFEIKYSSFLFLPLFRNKNKKTRNLLILILYYLCLDHFGVEIIPVFIRQFLLVAKFEEKT